MLAVTLLLQRCRLIRPKGKDAANLQKRTKGWHQAWGTASHRKQRLATPVLHMGHTGNLYVKERASEQIALFEKKYMQASQELTLSRV